MTPLCLVALLKPRGCLGGIRLFAIAIVAVFSLVVDLIWER
jgi:hypothetical protein